MTSLPLANRIARAAAVRDDGRLLRFALRLDGAASGALGVVALAAAGALGPPLGLTAGALRGTGAFLVIYALALVLIARPSWRSAGASRRRCDIDSLASSLIAARPAIPRPAAWAVVIGNTAWVLGSAGAVVAGRDSLTVLGVAVVLAQAAAVAVFIDLQWLGLRRAR